MTTICRGWLRQVQGPIAEWLNRLGELGGAGGWETRQAGVGAAKMEQRRLNILERRHARAHNFTEEDSVIAAGISSLDAAFHVGQDIRQNRRSSDARSMRDVLELPRPLPGETLGEQLLIFLEQMDRKGLSLQESLITLG